MSALIRLGLNKLAPARELVVSRPMPAWEEVHRPPETARTTSPEPLSNESAMAAVPRWCAVHDRRYVAWYRREDGRYMHTNTARLTADIVRGGFSGELISTSLRIAGEAIEICPWCGTSGSAAILCGRCGQWSCYGRSDGDYYHRCRPSCGGHGKISPDDLEVRGVIPRMR
jgi:hypothetical protein